SITRQLSAGANELSPEAGNTGLSWGARSAPGVDPMRWLGLALFAGSLLVYFLLFLLGTRYHPSRDENYLMYRSRNRARRGLWAGLPPLSTGRYGGGFGGGAVGGGGFSGGGGYVGGGGGLGGWWRGRV